VSANTIACRWLALAGYFLLLALLLNWYTWLAPPTHVPVSVALAIVAVPLLLPLRGLLHGRAYTHAWTSFLALPYFALGVDGVAGGVHPPWIGWVAIVSSVALFCGAVGYARLRGRELQAMATAAGSEHETRPRA